MFWTINHFYTNSSRMHCVECHNIYFYNLGCKPIFILVIEAKYELNEFQTYQVRNIQWIYDISKDSKWWFCMCCVAKFYFRLHFLANKMLLRPYLQYFWTILIIERIQEKLKKYNRWKPKWFLILQLQCKFCVKGKFEEICQHSLPFIT